MRASIATTSSIAVTAALTVVGCWSGSGGNGANGTGSASNGAQKGADTAGGLSLTGAGATFPFPLYTKWISVYTRDKPGLKINYQSIGSGGGIRQITERTVDFGATDAPMSDEQLAKAGGVVHIPTALGAVVLTYNLDGIQSGLELTPEAVAGIFLGKVTRWSDPAIQGPNPELKLPDRAIASIHRSDGSGTTRIFVDYLSAVSPAWKAGPGSGTSVDWPGGLGAKGNEGVAGQVASTPGSIGYVELVYAAQNKLSYAAMRNAAGRFVMPTLESVTAAAAGAVARMPDDMRVSIVDAQGEGAYPIAGFTYILLYKEQRDPATGRALVDFLKWSIHEGQELTRDLNYAPLPDAVVKMADAKLAGIGPLQRDPAR